MHVSAFATAANTTAPPFPSASVLIETTQSGALEPQCNLPTQNIFSNTDCGLPSVKSHVVSVPDFAAPEGTGVDAKGAPPVDPAGRCILPPSAEGRAVEKYFPVGEISPPEGAVSDQTGPKPEAVAAGSRREEVERMRCSWRAPVLRASRRRRRSTPPLAESGQSRFLRRLARRRVRILSEVFGDVDVARKLVRNAMNLKGKHEEWLGTGFLSDKDLTPRTAVTDFLPRPAPPPRLAPPSVLAFATPKVAQMPPSDPAAPSPEVAPPKQKTMEDVIAALEGPAKVSTIAKSNADWDTFKSSHAGLDKRLRLQAEGAGAFLQRKEFLERCDLRQFEAEKEGRAGQRRHAENM